MTFDRLAPFYRWMENIAAGRMLERCRAAHLASVPAPSRVLLLGEGHGRTLAACRRQFPSAAITCIEASAGMIDQARQNLARQQIGTGGIEFVHANVFDWQPPVQGIYDLIVTHFFLDCFTALELEKLIPYIASAAAPAASWLIADFQIAPSGWRRWRTRLILWMLYTFFRAATGLSVQALVPTDALLRQSGFELQHRTEFSAQLLKSEWWRKAHS